MSTPARMSEDGVRLPPPDHHRDISGGALRPALFGAMDGLVSNTCLIAGVAASGVTTKTVALAGLAGLVAGAFSMGAGEYISVRVQQESTLAEVALEALELHRSPESEKAELVEAYVERGLDRELARQVAEQLSEEPVTALRAHAQEELGLDIDRLPSPWTASVSSLAAFSLGALVPALPYFLHARVVWISLVLSSVALFGAGAVASRFTGRKILYSGTRQLLVGVVAAGITFGIGHLVGSNVS